MEWQWVLLVLVGGLLLFLLSGMPVAMAFFAINLITMAIIYGGADPLRLWALSVYSSLAKFALAPVPLFVLMGEIMFQSGIATRMMKAMDLWFGRVPGRLSLMAVGSGVIFATLSGSSVASAAMLGSVLVPEMRKQGYSVGMSAGPVMASGTLAVMIPPTAFGVLMASLARVSVSSFLLAIIIPGLMMAMAYAIYIVGKAYLDPKSAPPYRVSPTPFVMKLKDTILYIVPLGLIIFLVIGLMLIGVATPNESAALGVLGCFFLAIVYQRGVKWATLFKALRATISVTGMLFLIFAASTAFAQILAYSGATTAIVELAIAIIPGKIGALAVMMGILLIMGMFMEPLSIMMVTLPIFLPIAAAFDIDATVLCVLMLVNLEAAVISPPFGMCLFVMKGIMPPDVTMTQLWRSSVPFIGCIVVVIVVLIFFPQAALWLPNLVSGK